MFGMNWRAWARQLIFLCARGLLRAVERTVLNLFSQSRTLQYARECQRQPAVQGGSDTSLRNGFSNANYEGGLTPRKAAGFVGHAVTKLRAQLQKGAESGEG